MMHGYKGKEYWMRNEKSGLKGLRKRIPIWAVEKKKRLEVDIVCMSVFVSSNTLKLDYKKFEIGEV